MRIINRNNRYDNLHKKVEVIKVFIANSSGVDQCQWCSDNCEHRWSFSRWRLLNQPNVVAEFHFESKEDVENFMIFWKLAGLTVRLDLNEMIDLLSKK